ncbi:MAG TPA: hypothetical protein VJ140_07800 [Actinomycetota bacterium]|nr:hypothetical protein [Actinomycetota bacterium]
MTSLERERQFRREARVRRHSMELLDLVRLIPVLDTNWTPAEAQAWEARRRALLARIDGKEPG